MAASGGAPSVLRFRPYRWLVIGSSPCCFVVEINHLETRWPGFGYAIRYVLARLSKLVRGPWSLVLAPVCLSRLCNEMFVFRYNFCDPDIFVKRIKSRQSLKPMPKIGNYVYT